MKYLVKNILVFIFFMAVCSLNYSAKLDISQVTTKSELKKQEFVSQEINLFRDWQIKENKIGGNTLIDISFIDEMNGWVSSVKGSFIRHHQYNVRAGELYKTTDGGKTWEEINIDIPHNSFISKILFISKLKGWLVVQREANQAKKQNAQFWILETDDGGNSWTTTYTLQESRLSKIKFKDNGEGWIIGSNVKKNDFGIFTSGFIHYSTNFGKTWTNIGSKLVNIENEKQAQRPGNKSYIVDINLGETGQASVLQNDGYIFMIDANNLTFKEKFSVQNKNNLFKVSNLKLGFSHFVQKSENSFLTLQGQNLSEGTISVLIDIREGITSSVSTLDDVYLLDLLKISNQEIVACGYKNTLEQKDKLNQILSRKGIIIFSNDDGETWNVLYEKVGVVLSTQNGGETWDTIKANSITEDFLSFNKINFDKKDGFFVIGNNGLFLSINKNN